MVETSEELKEGNIIMTYTDLSGKYGLFTDKSKEDRIPDVFPYEIELPNTTSNAGIGETNNEKCLGYLTDIHRFEGYAWFRRKINVTTEMTKNNLMLFLERTRKTAVYIDGAKIGEYCSLCTPHKYFLNGLSAGEHELIVRVDNTDYPTGGGHLTSPDTQTNWNGITGRIGLFSFKSLPYAIRTEADITGGRLMVRGKVMGDCSEDIRIRLHRGGRIYGEGTAPIENGRFSCVIKLEKDVPLWNEFNPELLELEIAAGEDVKIFKTGLRQLKAEGLKIRVNGNEAFLRGKHDGLVFPKTGFAPTDAESWLKVFETAKSYGINHYRFHTCCPPEAAFEAADITGIYLQPELPFWGTVPDEATPETEFLRQEGFRLLEEFGFHPSFAMMTMGNELWGSKERINGLVGEYKAEFPDKLYCGGSNNFQFVPCVLENEDFFSGARLGRHRLIRGSTASCDAPFGFVQTDPPSSDHCYDDIIRGTDKGGEANRSGEILIQQGTSAKKVSAEDGERMLIPDVPVISHEIGQYAIYPDYKEIPMYKGPVRHTPYESYRERAEEKGLLPFAEDFFAASGKLAAECYRREIEAAISSENFSGFQILDLQDFPGQGVATVGILNAFMESKGIISPEEWRRFCGVNTLYARLPKFIYKSGEKISFDIVASYTLPDSDIKSVCWKITGEDTIAQGEAVLTRRSERISRTENIDISLNCGKPQKLSLTVTAEDGVFNEYGIYLYPDIDVDITEDKIRYGEKILPIVHDLKLAAPDNLCIPPRSENDLRGEYANDFWCYGMFKSISESMGKPVPTGTLGLLADTKSKLLGGFASENHTTPIWYNIVTHSFAYNLEGTDIIPDVWVIDNPDRACRLGLLYRKDGCAVCTSRLWEIGESIEVKHFAACLVKGILGD